MGSWNKLFGKSNKKKSKKSTGKKSNGKKKNDEKKSGTSKKTGKKNKKTNKTLKAAQKAYKKGKNITYLGTKQETTSTVVGKAKHKTGKGARDTGTKEKLKSVNALTKTEFNRMTDAQRLNNKKAGNKLLKGSKRTGQKDIREKVGSKTAESAYKSKAATGFMQGMSKADVFSNSVGTYNKTAKKAIKKTKDSTAYGLGYAAGIAADMAIGGRGSKGASAAELAGKAGAKVAAKAGAKTAAKNVAKKAAKETAEKTSKKAAKTFAKNRAGELVAETPSNLLDAAKMSMDENGKIDKKEFAKYTALNTGMTVGVGGAMEGVGGAITKKQSDTLAELLEKQGKGKKLTKEEGQKLSKLKNKLEKKAGGEVETASKVTAEDTMSTANATIAERRLSKGKAKGRSAKDRNAQAKWDKAQTEYNAQGRRLSDKDQARNWENAQSEYSSYKADADKKADSELVAYRSEKNQAKAVENAQALQTQAKNLPSREEIQTQIKDAEDRSAKLKTLRRNATTEEQAKMLDDSIEKVENDIANLRKQEGTVWNVEKSVEKYGDLTTSSAKNADDATDNLAVSATKTADDTVTPKSEETSLGVKSEPSTSTSATKEAFAKYAEKDGTLNINKLPDDLQEAVLKESFEEEKAVEKATNEAFAKYVKTHPAYKDFKETEDLLEEWESLMESIQTKEGIPQATAAQEKRISEIQDRFEELGYDFDPSVGDYVERRNMAMRKAYKDFLETDAYKRIWDKGETTEQTIKDEVEAEIKALEDEGIEVTESVEKRIEDAAELGAAEAKAEGKDVASEIETEVKGEVDEIEKEIAREPRTANKQNKSFDDVAKDQDYRAEAEKVMAENPKMGQNAAKQNVLYYDTDEMQESFFAAYDEGMFGKSSKVTQKEAKEAVEEMAKEETLENLANQFLGKDITSDPHIFGAMAKNLIDRLRAAYKETNDPATLELLLKVSDHANMTVSQGASFTNAAKMWVSLTETGRVKAMENLVERLNKQNVDRLKKPLELTEEQKGLIMKAETDEEVAQAVATVERQLTDQIPSTFWEKVNTLRHLSMLGNIRTNVRNLAGNGAFAGARAMSDGIEYFATKAMAKQFEKKGIDAIRTTTGFATKEEKDVALPFIKEQFEKNYNANSSRYKDLPENSVHNDKTVLETKAGSAVEKFVYACLEKGDMAFFKPEYNRNYIRWIKHNVAKQDGKVVKITQEMIDGLTDAQKRQANKYAMDMAEKATFRETTKASKLLTQLKAKTATKKGKTVFGTIGYRAANVALESSIPFVKTPINVFRQSVDYSPIGLVKSFGEFLTFAKRGDTDALAQAIHHFATGLTGGGVCVAGYLLAEQGLIMVKAGEKSGDAYYDRDMGYQDYSLIIGNKSFTIDWSSPLQSALFMGAQIKNNLDNTGMDARQTLNAFSSLLLPHLEASFMSGTADALEMFMETAYSTKAKTANDENYNSGADWGGAILKTFGGTIPQNFLTTALLPFSQLSAQVAGAIDPYQRDTSSTKEGMLENSWDSYLKKTANRIPFVRELLETKVDRRGNDVKSSPIDNVVGRLANALMNPSTVKEITFDKTDKELIKIYKNMSDGDEKKYFFYNFTGKPDYELEGSKEGQRMTYKEAHDYLVTSRKEQNNCIQEMLNAKSYKNMTWDMRAEEVNSSYWISKSVADMNTYSPSYACSALNLKADKNAWKSYKLYGGKAKNFMNFYLTKEKLVARSHDTGYNTKALAVVLSGDKKIRKFAKAAYNIYDTKIEAADAYLEAGGNATEYTNAACNIMSTINKANTDKYPVSDSYSNKAVAAANHKINKRTYAAMGISADKANMGYWFKYNTDADGGKYTLESLQVIKANGEVDYDLGTKKGVTAYIESIGENMTQVEKACLFEYLDQNNSNNPYGSIPNYLNLEDSSSSGGSGGGWGSGGWGSGGSGSSSGSGAVGYDEYNYKTIKTKTVVGSSSSSTDDAYRKKLRQYMKNLRS